jgi:addiction module RelE/StbE family toxin
MVKIVWTELAISDLKDIYNFIAYDSSRYAFIKVNKIFQRIQPVKENPNFGRKVPEFNNETIREVIEGKYRIIYRKVNDYQIDVLRIYHSARLLRKKNIK